MGVSHSLFGIELFSAVGCGLSVNESTTYIEEGDFKQKYTQNKAIDGSAPEDLRPEVLKKPTLYLS
jgi:hypothetical protein